MFVIVVHRSLLKLSRMQHRAIEAILEMQRQFYNAALQERQDAWRLRRVSIGYADQTASLRIVREDDPLFSALPHSLSRWTLRRVENAMQAFFDRVTERKAALAAGLKPKPVGYPRFRSMSHWNSFGLADMDGCRMRGSKLLLKGMVGDLKMRLHQPIPDGAEVKTASFTREGRRWFVQLTLDVAAVAEHARPGTSTGVDVGIERLATLADGSYHENVRPRSKRSAGLKRAARALSRAKRGSRRRRAARARLASIQRNVANARRNHLHAVSKAIASSYETVVVEELKLRNMTRSASGTVAEPGNNVAQKRGLNRALADAAPGRLLDMIRYKAERAGGAVIEVDPKGTSQTCPLCRAKVAKALSERRHVCPCGADMHRDHASAIVIHERGLATAPAGGTARRDAKPEGRRKAGPKARPRNAKPLAA